MRKTACGGVTHIYLQRFPEDIQDNSPRKRHEPLSQPLSSLAPEILGCSLPAGSFNHYTFVSWRSIELRSAPSVKPACAAPRGDKPNTAVLASAPLPLPLQGSAFAPEPDSASLRSNSPFMKRMYFFGRFRRKSSTTKTIRRKTPSY
jgi:hypothetical protein